jgi:hypothetical protein
MDSRLKVLGQAVLGLGLCLLVAGCAHRREVVYPSGGAAPAGLLTPMPAALGASKQMPVMEIEGPSKVAPTLQMDAMP